MLAHANVTWMKSNPRSFTNDRGEVVEYYRATVLDQDCEPMVLPCSAEVHDFASREIPKNTEVEVILNVSSFRNGLRVRIDNIVIV